MNRKFTILTALAIAAAPALAPAKAPVEKPVSAESKAGKRALLDENVVTVRNVSRAEIVHGLSIVDDDGAPVGEVERLAGNDVIVSDGTAEYRVPFDKVYAFSKDGADRYASRIPKARLKPEPIVAAPPPPAPPPPEMDSSDPEMQGPEGGPLPDDGEDSVAPAPEAVPATPGT